MRAVPGVDDELERRVEALGYEVVEVVWAGSARRPILRIRIDRPGSTPGHGVTVDDCATVSRELEPWLDGLEEVAERYVLEVSSPGVERPLVKTRDWARFAGRRVAVTGKAVLAGRATRLEGELVGLATGEGGGEAVRLRLPDGEEVVIGRGEIKGAHLVHDWE